MKTWTAHTRHADAPVLVKEAFSWGAFLFGPVWLFWQKAWIAGALYAALLIVAGVLLPGPVRGVAFGGLAVLVGLTGRDMVRWSLKQRGYTLCHVLAARDSDAAMARLLTARPDLASAVADLP